MHESSIGDGQTFDTAMNEIPPMLEPRPWQREFVRRFLEERPQRALLVAQTGAGKTGMALQLASRLADEGAIDSVMVVSAAPLLSHWQANLESHGFGAGVSRDGAARGGLVLAYGAVRNETGRSIAATHLARSKCFVVIDDADGARPALDEWDALIRDDHPGTTLLFLARSRPRNPGFEATFEIATELYSFAQVISDAPLLARIREGSPSFPLIQSINRRILTLDSLSWRDFERLVAELMQRAGYEVELMQGSRDGGVDIVAMLRTGALGSFKVLLQAKKYATHRRLGLALVRELSDTVAQHDANKGILVTTSYLTAGALERIQLQRYRLGKMDRDDLSRMLMLSQ